MTCLLRRRNVSSTLAALRQRTSPTALAHLDDPLQPSGPAPKAAQSAGVLLRGNPISRAARRPVKTRRQSVGSGATFGRLESSERPAASGVSRRVAWRRTTTGLKQTRGSSRQEWRTRSVSPSPCSRAMKNLRCGSSGDVRRRRFEGRAGPRRPTYASARGFTGPRRVARCTQRKASAPLTTRPTVTDGSRRDREGPEEAHEQAAQAETQTATAAKDRQIRSHDKR